MSKKVISNRALKHIAVAVSTAASVVMVQQASADGLMFPYVAASTQSGGVVTTILSVAYSNKSPGASGTGAGAASALHYQTWYKPATGNDATDRTSSCLEDDLLHPTSANDIVTYDMGGVFGGATDAKGVLFGDGANIPTKKANYGITRFDRLNLLVPAGRAFQVITDEEDTNDGEIYGEALLLDLAHGAAWGYRGYNSADAGGGLTVPYFSNKLEVQGEVLMEGELAPVEFYPPAEWTQKFLVTPIAKSTDPAGQIQGSLNATLQFRTGRNAYAGAAGPQIMDKPTVPGGSVVGSSNTLFDRDENPFSGGTLLSVTCIAAIDSKDMLVGLANAGLINGGWSYTNVLPGTTGNKTNQAVVMKLIFNNGSTINGETGLTGTVNSELWLRDGSCTGWDELTTGTTQGCDSTPAGAPIPNNRKGIDLF